MIESDSRHCSDCDPTDLCRACIERANRRTRERYDRDKQCCGCRGHVMEQRGREWWCYTCGAWAVGCGR
jgi:hypothetical protein